jgi:hypothetical protein
VDINPSSRHIIIMQRRKIPQPVKSKLKLVIERPSCLGTNEDPSKLVRSISISKMATVNK